MGLYLGPEAPITGFLCIFYIHFKQLPEYCVSATIAVLCIISSSLCYSWNSTYRNPHKLSDWDSHITI